MTIGTLRCRAAHLRRNAFAVAVLSAGPLLAGCVSAVDESAMFGFNAASPPAEIAGDNAPSADMDVAALDTVATAENAVAAGEAEGAVAAPALQTEASQEIAAAAESETGRQSAAFSAAPAQNGAPAAAESSVPLATGRTSVAAYAGGTVTEGGTALAPGEGRKADRTLFASLFAQSEPKTPLANADNGRSRRVLLRREGAPVPAGGADSLPGVDPSSLFEIGQRASADDEDMLEDASASYEVASLSGMARLAPNGLLVQREDVQTHCFEPKLVNMLRMIERKFGKKVVVTSGYRSPSHNKRVNGASRSQHMACKAADIQVPGIDSLAVAAFARSLPDRGGVGTYCHTTSVHVDIGRQRDWNWRCRRRS